MDVELSAAEQARYADALALPGFGPRSQERLKESRSLVIGAGPVGAVVAAQLASAGAGYVGVVDPARVAQADLASQSVHFAPDLGINKADSAAAKLGILNPEVQVDSYPVELSVDNADAMVVGYEVVACCISDADTRLLVGDACLVSDVALIDVAVSGTRSVVTVVGRGEHGCLRCAGIESGSIAEDGALPALGAVAGAFAAMEAIKLLSGVGEQAAGRLVIDGMSGTVATEAIARRPDCPACKAATVEAPA